MGVWGAGLWGAGLWGIGQATTVTSADGLGKPISLCSGLTYNFSTVYKTNDYTTDLLLTISGANHGTIIENVFSGATDWSFNTFQFTATGNDAAAVAQISITGPTAGEWVKLNFISLSPSGYENPLIPVGATASLYSNEYLDSTKTSWPVAEVYSDSDYWDFTDKTFVSECREPLTHDLDSQELIVGNTYSGSISSSVADGDCVVFSVYLERSLGGSKSVANDGIFIDVGLDSEVGRTYCFLPSGAPVGKKYRFSTYVIASGSPSDKHIKIHYLNNNHGESYAVIATGLKVEIADVNQYPVKYRPGVYSSMDSNAIIDGYEVRMSLEDGWGTGMVSEVSIEEGLPGISELQSINKYSDLNSYKVQHSKLKEVTILKNHLNAPITQTINNGESFYNKINMPIKVRNGSTYEFSFRYQAENLLLNDDDSGSGILYGYEKWSDLGTFDSYTLLGSGLTSPSNWDKEETRFIFNDSSVEYLVPFIMVSGCKGTVYIDNVKFIDVELDRSTRTYHYDKNRPTIPLKLSNNYSIVNNTFKDNLGSTVWKDDEEDIFIQDTIGIEKAPNFNFIWREDIYYYPYRNSSYYQYLDRLAIQAKTKSNLPYAGWQTGPDYNQYLYETQKKNLDISFYNGFKDHQEEIEQISYIDAITSDEDYRYILHHSSSVLETFNGSDYGDEFRNNANRFYLTRKSANQDDSIVIRLNDGLTRDIKLNDGQYFVEPVYPEREVTNASPNGWATGTMTDIGGQNVHSTIYWNSMIHDIATHPDSAFIFYCGQTYYWDDQTSPASSQTLYYTNFVAAIPKSFPDSVGYNNIKVSTISGAVEKQYGVIIYASGGTTTPNGVAPGFQDIPRFVGLACTGEKFDDSDMHAVVIAEADGIGPTASINLKLLTHSAYEELLDVEFGEFAHANGAREPETDYDSDNVIIRDIMQVQDLELAQLMYNGIQGNVWDRKKTVFQLSYNPKSKILYGYSAFQVPGPNIGRFYILKDFSQWSYDRKKYYDGQSIFTTPNQSEINYKYLTLTDSDEHIEIYNFPTVESGFNTDFSKEPSNAFYDYLSDYMLYVSTARINDDNGNEVLNSRLKSWFRCSYRLDGQNLISIHADGSKGYVNQTQFIDDCEYPEPLIWARTSFGDEHLLETTPLPSGTYNNLKITKDYTINYMTGELWYNSIPGLKSFSRDDLLYQSDQASSYYSVLSGSAPSGANDLQLFASYSNRYTIPYSWAEDESIVDFLGRVADADGSIARIDTNGNIQYSPIEYANNTRLGSNGFQGINYYGLPIQNLGLSIEQNEGVVQNALFDRINPSTKVPINYNFVELGSGMVSTSSDLSKFSRRAGSIVSSGYDFVGKIYSSPVKAAPNTQYSASVYYNTFDIDENQKYGITKSRFLHSGSLDGWSTTTTSGTTIKFNNSKITKNPFALDITIPQSGSVTITYDVELPVDLREDIVFDIEHSLNASASVDVVPRLVFTDDSDFLPITISNTGASSTSSNIISVTGSSVSAQALLGSFDSLGISPRFIKPEIYISGDTSGEARLFITDILLSGSRGHGPIFNIYEYDSSGTLIATNKSQLLEKSFGFIRKIKTFTTQSNTDSIILETSLKYTPGIQLVDGFRIDAGSKPDNFVIGDSLLNVADMPFGETSYTRDYKEGYDYLYDVDKSVVSRVNKNIMPNGYFSKYFGPVPDAFIISITGASDTEYPTIFRYPSGGYFNNGSLRVSMSGDGYARLTSKLISFDSDLDHQIEMFYRIGSGATTTSSYLDKVRILQGWSLYNEMGDKIYEYLDEDD